MKRVYLLVPFFVFTLLFSSCGFHNGLTSNFNNHNTEVVLSEANYTIVDSVMGSAKASYILGLGGVSKKSLIAEAKAEMLRNANLVGSSKAIINETVEVHTSIVWFVRTKTITVSAHVIEFNQ